MPYIGRTPTNAPLTADDLNDDVVSTSKIQNNAVTSAKVSDNSIVNADINSSAAIATTKLENNAITINGSAVALGGSVTVGETKPTITTNSVVISPSTSQTFTLNGTNFISIPIVEFIASTGAITRATAVTFTSATALSITTNLASGSYYIRVENNDGNAVRSTNAILSASTSPTWSTAAGSLGTFEGGTSGTLATVAATSDSSITYSVTSGSSDLTSAGVTLNTSTGALTTSDFGGSSTTATTYTFEITATDGEGQTAARTFSLTSTFGATGGGQFN